MKIKDVELRWLGHAGFLINAHGKTIYIDPYNIKDGLPPADIVFLTHSHSDHCSLADMGKIIREGTMIVAPADCQSTITKFDVPIKMEIIEPEQELELGDIKIYALPSYNIDKHFHPKDEGWIGYLIKLGGVIVYHAGDTDVIPEMQAAKIIKPTLAIPIHWGSIIGSEADAKEFVELCEEEGIKAEVLKKE